MHCSHAALSTWQIEYAMNGLSVNTCGEVRYCMCGRLFQKRFWIFLSELFFTLFVLCPSGVVIIVYVHTMITEIWQFVQVANYIIIQLLLHMYCACFYAVSCSLTCHFHLPLQPLLTVGQYQLLNRLHETKKVMTKERCKTMQTLGIFSNPVTKMK